MPGLILLDTELKLGTRRNVQIHNTLKREPCPHGLKTLIEDYRKDYPEVIHRPVGPSGMYNCHGLTFAARRAQIWKAPEVLKILEHDEYREVRIGEVLSGDIAVYYNEIDVEHSGVVVWLHKLLGPLILSKWGPCHEAIHAIGRCPYDSSNVKFYRVQE